MQQYQNSRQRSSQWWLPTDLLESIQQVQGCRTLLWPETDGKGLDYSVCKTMLWQEQQMALLCNGNGQVLTWQWTSQPLSPVCYSVSWVLSAGHLLWCPVDAAKPSLDLSLPHFDTQTTGSGRCGASCQQTQWQQVWAKWWHPPYESSVGLHHSPGAHKLFFPGPAPLSLCPWLRIWGWIWVTALCLFFVSDPIVDLVRCPACNGPCNQQLGRLAFYKRLQLVHKVWVLPLWAFCHCTVYTGSKLEHSLVWPLQLTDKKKGTLILKPKLP